MPSLWSRYTFFIFRLSRILIDLENDDSDFSDSDSVSCSEETAKGKMKLKQIANKGHLSKWHLIMSKLFYSNMRTYFFCDSMTLKIQNAILRTNTNFLVLHTCTLFLLTSVYKNGSFYFHSFLAFCIRMLLAALDHHLHSFRPKPPPKMVNQSGRNSIPNVPSIGTQNPSKLRNHFITSHIWWPAF